MRDWLIVNWLALLALLVALTSLVFAYRADTHMSGQASSIAAPIAIATGNAGASPKITFMTGEDRNAEQAGIEMRNGGPGFAIIKSVDYFIDGRRMPDEEAVIDVAPKGARNALQYTHMNPGARIAPNADAWLLFLPRRDTRPREYERLQNFMSDSVAVNVRYCSEQNACADACSKAGACGPQR